MENPTADEEHERKNGDANQVHPVAPQCFGETQFRVLVERLHGELTIPDHQASARNGDGNAARPRRALLLAAKPVPESNEL